MCEIQSDVLLCLWCEHILVACGCHAEYLCQFVGLVVFKFYLLRKARSQSGVGIKEILHIFRISGEDNDETSLIVENELHESIYRFMSEAVTVSLIQGVGFVYKEYATESTSHHFLNLWCGLSDIRSDEILTCHLDKPVCGQQSERHEDVCHDTSHGGLSCPGIAVEDVVVGKDFRRITVHLGTHLLELYDVGHTAHLVLDTLQSDEIVELGETFVYAHLLWSVVRYVCRAYSG